jgi:hypothetical protein
MHVNGSLQVANELNVGGNATTAGSAGTAGQVLKSNGAGVAPSWQTDARFFYMPSIVFDTTVPATGQVKDLYTLYKNQFANIPSNAKSTSAPSAIPYFPNASDLYYYVTGYDSSVFKINSINNMGVLNYDILSNATSSSFINIVFVAK